MKKRLEMRVFGRVQGVLFRDFTNRQAKKLGIFGTVKNEKQGSVFIVSEGEEDTLRKFLGLIEKGSLFSRVDKVEEEWKDVSGEFNNFSVIYYDE